MIRRLHFVKFAVRSLPNSAFDGLRLLCAFSSVPEDRNSTIQTELDRLMEGEDVSPKKASISKIDPMISPKKTTRPIKLSRKQAISASAFSLEVPLINPVQLEGTINTLVPDKENNVDEFIQLELTSIRTEEALVQFAASNTDLLDGPTRLALLSKIYEIYRLKKRGGSQAILDEYLSSPNVAPIFRAILASFKDLTPHDLAELFTILAKNQFRNEEYDSVVEKYLSDVHQVGAALWGDKTHYILKVLYRMGQTGYKFKHFNADSISKLANKMTKQADVPPQRLVITLYYYYKLVNLLKYSTLLLWKLCLLTFYGSLLSELSMLVLKQNSLLEEKQAHTMEGKEPAGTPETNDRLELVNFVQALRPHLENLEVSQLSLVLSVIPKDENKQAVTELLGLLRDGIIRKSRQVAGNSVLEGDNRSLKGVDTSSPQTQGLNWSEIREILRAANYSKCQDAVLFEEVLSEIKRNLVLLELRQPSTLQPTNTAVQTTTGAVPASIPAKELLLVMYYLYINMDVMTRIEMLVVSHIITISAEDISLLFSCHARMVWRLRAKLEESAKKKSHHIKKNNQLRVLTQEFWDSVLPSVSQRLYEFDLRQLMIILQSAVKPFVGKKSVVRLLAGFCIQAIELLSKLKKTDPVFIETAESLKQLIPALFQKAELQGVVMQRLDSVINSDSN